MNQAKFCTRSFVDSARKDTHQSHRNGGWVWVYEAGTMEAGELARRAGRDVIPREGAGARTVCVGEAFLAHSEILHLVYNFLDYAFDFPHLSLQSREGLLVCNSATDVQYVSAATRNVYHRDVLVVHSIRADVNVKVDNSRTPLGVADVYTHSRVSDPTSKSLKQSYSPPSR